MTQEIVARIMGLKMLTLRVYKPQYMKVEELRPLELLASVPHLSPETVHRHEQLEYLMRRYGDKVLYLAYSCLRDKDWAEDVAQEVFLQVYTSLPRFQGNSSFYTWIYRITVNLCRDQLRRQIRRRRLEQKENWKSIKEPDPEEKALEKHRAPRIVGLHLAAALKFARNYTASLLPSVKHQGNRPGAGHIPDHRARAPLPGAQATAKILVQRQ